MMSRRRQFVLFVALPALITLMLFVGFVLCTEPAPPLAGPVGIPIP